MTLLKTRVKTAQRAIEERQRVVAELGTGGLNRDMIKGFDRGAALVSSTVLARELGLTTRLADLVLQLVGGTHPEVVSRGGRVHKCWWVRGELLSQENYSWARKTFCPGSRLHRPSPVAHGAGKRVAQGRPRG